MMPLSPTPRQIAEELAATMTLQERLTLCQQQISYLERLDHTSAPVITIDAAPDQELEEPIQLTLVGPEFLTQFRALAIAALRKSYQELQELQQLNPTL